MKIAQVAPLFESVPPRLYGGTERVVSYLTEELVRQGHEVTLFASGDSTTKAALVSNCQEALRLAGCNDPLSYHAVQLQEVIERAHQFDIIHFHTDYHHYTASQLSRYKHVTTLHGRLDLPELQAVYRKFSRVPLISISNHQRRPIPYANWTSTIYHGLPRNLYKQGDGKGKYLAFIGRISPEKRVDRAIEIAIHSGMNIKIAAKVDAMDTDYFEEKIRSMMNHPLVEFIGEIGEHEKRDFLGNAVALLFPIDWPEPFGMVMIESFANGTPVIAFPSGSVPEIMKHGETGFIVESVDEAVKAVKEVATISRTYCRQYFEKYFTAQVMAKNHLAAYQRLLNPLERIKAIIPSRQLIKIA